MPNAPFVIDRKLHFGWDLPLLFIAEPFRSIQRMRRKNDDINWVQNVRA